MIDLATIDPASLQPGPETDALIAEKRMGWYLSPDSQWWVCPPTYEMRRVSGWSPSTDPEDAGEARRKADLNGVKHHGLCTVAAFVVANDDNDGHCDYSETNGDKGAAEALATCRAIVAALKAAEAAKGDE